MWAASQSNTFELMWTKLRLQSHAAPSTMSQESVAWGLIGQSRYLRVVLLLKDHGNVSLLYSQALMNP